MIEKNKENEIKRRELSDTVKIFLEPLSYDDLVNNGTLQKINRSYYCNNLRELPENVLIKISDYKITDKGIKLKFYKVTSKMKETISSLII